MTSLWIHPVLSPLSKRPCLKLMKVRSRMEPYSLSSVASPLLYLCLSYLSPASFSHFSLPPKHVSLPPPLSISLSLSLPYQHQQTKVRPIHSSGNLFNTYRYGPWFGMRPRVVSCTAHWGITPSVLVWKLSKGPWEGGKFRIGILSSALSKD